MRMRAPAPVISGTGGKTSAGTHRRNWHRQYAPCVDHESVPDCLEAIRLGGFDGERLDCRVARETPQELAARLLNGIVTGCEPCRLGTHVALVEYARKLPAKKIVDFR